MVGNESLGAKLLEFFAPALPLTSCLTLDKLLRCSVLYFSPVYTGDNNRTYLKALLQGVNESTVYKALRKNNV